MSNPIEVNARTQLDNACKKQAEIDQQCSALDAQIVQHEEALAALEAADIAEEAEGKERAERLAALEQRVIDAKAIELVAIRTPSEQTTKKQVSALQAEVTTLRKDTDAWVESALKRRGTRLKERERLAEQIANDRGALAYHQQLRAALAQQHADIHTGLGFAVHERLAHDLREQDEHVAGLEATVEESERERRTLYRDALDELRDWPELQTQLTAELGPPERPIEDNTSRILDAWLHFLRVLERDGAYLAKEIAGRDVLDVLELSKPTLALLTQQPNQAENVRQGLAEQNRHIVFNQKRSNVEALRAVHRPQPYAPLTSLVQQLIS